MAPLEAPSGDGWPPSGRQPGDRVAKGLFGASSTRTVLASRVEPGGRWWFRPAPDFGRGGGGTDVAPGVRVLRSG